MMTPVKVVPSSLSGPSWLDMHLQTMGDLNLCSAIANSAGAAAWSSEEPCTGLLIDAGGTVKTREFCCSTGEGGEDSEEDDGAAAADVEDGSLDIGDDDGSDSEADEEMGDEFEEETAAEERRRSHSDASASDSEGEGDRGAEGAAAGDNKAASFARAFAKIMATGGTQKGILSVGALLQMCPQNFSPTSDIQVCCISGGSGDQ